MCLSRAAALPLPEAWGVRVDVEQPCRNHKHVTTVQHVTVDTTRCHGATLLALSPFKSLKICSACWSCLIIWGQNGRDEPTLQCIGSKHSAEFYNSDQYQMTIALWPQSIFPVHEPLLCLTRPSMDPWVSGACGARCRSITASLLPTWQMHHLAGMCWPHPKPKLGDNLAYSLKIDMKRHSRVLFYMSFLSAQLWIDIPTPDVLLASIFNF